MFRPTTHLSDADRRSIYVKIVEFVIIIFYRDRQTIN